MERLIKSNSLAATRGVFCRFRSAPMDEEIKVSMVSILTLLFGFQVKAYRFIAYAAISFSFVTIVSVSHNFS